MCNETLVKVSYYPREIQNTNKILAQLFSPSSAINVTWNTNWYILQMDLSSEEEILEIEIFDEEQDIDEISVSSLNENFYVKGYDDKQRAREKVTDKINSIFGCNISTLSKVNDLKVGLEKQLEYLDKKHDLSSSTPSELNSSHGRGEIVYSETSDSWIYLPQVRRSRGT